MNKSQLTNFITKYTLGGEIKSTKWTSDGNDYQQDLSQVINQSLVVLF